jgi:hypothetical protein
MDSECVISQELGNRISKLESQNRRLRQTGAATLVVLTLLVIMGQASSRKTVEANEFILRDGNGNVRARLSMNESLSNPEMVLLDEKGRTLVKVEGGNGSLSGGVVSVFDSQGNLRGLISGQGFGGLGGHISLLDSTGRPKTTISPGDIWVAGGIRLEDDDGFAAWLGRTGLLYQGETQTASAASLILVDNPHSKVLWKAP